MGKLGENPYFHQFNINAKTLNNREILKNINAVLPNPFYYQYGQKYGQKYGK